MEHKIHLSQSELPEAWYNVQADLPTPLPPPLHPGTGQPLGPQDLAPLFAMELIKQEVSQEKWIEIPAPVRDLYKVYRPTPLVRAVNLEKALKTNCRIWFKNESISPAGSHKMNTAIAQAYYNKMEGTVRLTTETGAGQWGSSLAFACDKFGLKLTVYMVKSSYHQKPYRKSLMHLWGAEVFPSPTELTNSGRAILQADPNCLGSLGISISEAVEDAATHEDAKYTLGSVLNHVILHQSVIGLETKKQLQIAGEKPDILIGCVGGGSNFGGFAFPFLEEKLGKWKDLRFIGVEPTACPTLTKGVFAYDYGDTAKLAPMVKMYTLGHGFMPPGIHAGGLRYHGVAPLVAHLQHLGLSEAQAYTQNACFEAAALFSRCEGIVPAPESSHAIRAAIEEAKKNNNKCIVFNLSGHGHFDLSAYDNYGEGKLQDYEYPAEKVAEALKDLPKVDF